MYLLLISSLIAAAFSSPFIATFTGGELCSPGDLIWVDCNLCTCNLQGKPNVICARMWCQPQPRPKDTDPSDSKLEETNTHLNHEKPGS